MRGALAEAFLPNNARSLFKFRNEPKSLELPPPLSDVEPAAAGVGAAAAALLATPEVLARVLSCRSDGRRMLTAALTATAGTALAADAGCAACMAAFR